MSDVKVEVKTLDDLQPDPNNANKHTVRGHQLVENSLRKRGAFRSVAAAGKGVEKPVVMAGNLTIEKARDAGIEEVIFVHTNGRQIVSVIRDDLEPDSAEAIALGLEDNESGKQSYNADLDIVAALAAGDNAILSALRQEDKVFGSMLDGMGLKEETKDAPPAVDRAAELLEKWQVQPGDLWQIGEHRLICGDCTDKAVVERVMQGEKAQVCLTDPPYGLDAGKKSGKNNYNEYKDTRENLENLAGKWLPIARDLCAVVAFSPGVTNAWIYPEANWVMCWFYGGGQLRSSWGFNCWQPFLCYGKDPSLAAGKGARPDAVDMNTPANADDLDHPCPKPLKLWEWFIERLSFGDSDVFYEPFSGSGTTLVSCENLGRRCRAIEISPAYCAVALQRMADAFPGIEIRRIQ